MPFLFICTENKSEAKRRRTERVKREKINSAVNKDLENRKRSRSNSHSDQSRRGRGRPKSASAKKHEEERGMRAAEICLLDFLFVSFVTSKPLYHSISKLVQPVPDTLMWGRDWFACVETSGFMFQCLMKLTTKIWTCIFSHCIKFQHVGWKPLDWSVK